MPNQDRRKHPRIPVHIDVTYDNDVVLTHANVQDLSLGGANVFTALPLPVGTQLSIWFRGVDPGFGLKARVLRVTEEDPDDEAARPGMGIQFFGISSKEEEAIQELIDWYMAQPAPKEASPELTPGGASEQRYIETQVLSTIEASSEPTIQTKLPREVYHGEHELEATQLETAEFEIQTPFETSTPSDESIQTVRLSPQDLEEQRAARAAQTEAPSLETARIHPEDLGALQSAAHDAAGISVHEQNGDTITLPELPVFTPDGDSGEHPAESGERRAKKKRKR